MFRETLHSKFTESIRFREDSSSLLFGWDHSFALRSYESTLMLLNMNTLKDRREVADFVFVVKLLENVIDLPGLKS